jgi:KDO2-lipid IV(A) lauroyltransferase
MSDRRRHLERNLARVRPGLGPGDLRRLSRRGFGSYGRYWAESFALPSLDRRTIDDGLSFEGFEHILDALDAGTGPVVVLPHLGGWEWAAAWLAKVAEIPVAAVVETLEPPDLFEWFVELRRQMGIEVIPLGPSAAALAANAVLERKVLCLVADRDLSGKGVEVRLFGETTTLPAGPALLARRLGAPLLPTAVYFRRHDRWCRVGEPIDTTARSDLRADVTRITREVATVLEDLIDAAPDQWHLLAPNWPSDRLPTGG